MNELFSLVGEYRDMYDKLTDPEMDEESVKGMLDLICADIEVKAEGLVAIKDRLEMELDACEKQEKLWAERKRVRKNSLERLKSTMIAVLDGIGKNDIQAGDVKIHVQNAGGKLPLIVDENATVPERFTKLTIETDNELIRKALEDGEELDFARFGNRSRTIRFK